MTTLILLLACAPAPAEIETLPPSVADEDMWLEQKDCPAGVRLTLPRLELEPELEAYPASVTLCSYTSLDCYAADYVLSEGTLTVPCGDTDQLLNVLWWLDAPEGEE